MRQAMVNLRLLLDLGRAKPTLPLPFRVLNLLSYRHFRLRRPYCSLNRLRTPERRFPASALHARRTSLPRHTSTQSAIIDAYYIDLQGSDNASRICACQAVIQSGRIAHRPFTSCIVRVRLALSLFFSSCLLLCKTDKY